MKIEDLFSEEFIKMGNVVNLLAFEDTEEYRTIRGHIMLERLIDKLLCKRLSDYEKLLKRHRIYFDLKVDLCLSLGLIQDILAEALHTLNKIRNKLSHEESPNISMDDIKKLNTKYFNEPMFQKALDVVYKEGYKDSLMLSTLFLYWEVNRLIKEIK